VFSLGLRTFEYVNASANNDPYGKLKLKQLFVIKRL